MATSTIGIIGLILLYIVLFGLSIAWLVFMIIVLIKANKALSIWIRKNDTDIQSPFSSAPPIPYTPPAPPAQTNFKPED